MTTPLFSILIANYNNGKYIKEALQSVFEQTYTNWEVIIVDDASTDESKEIYKEYMQDSRIRIYFNEENKGVVYTKWFLLELARGEYCGFLDPDDAILPNALDVMARVHEKNEDISICSSRYYICDEEMNIIKECEYLNIPEGESYLTNMQYAPWHFVSFKLSKYRQTQKLDKRNRIGDDQELYLLLEEVGKWHVINDITYKYRKVPGSLSMQQGRKCGYWNLIVYHEACMRRGLNPEECSYRYFENLICFEQKLCLNTFDYKLGHFLLTPLRKIKKILSGF